MHTQWHIPTTNWTSTKNNNYTWCGARVCLRARMFDRWLASSFSLMWIFPTVKIILSSFLFFLILFRAGTTHTVFLHSTEWRIQLNTMTDVDERVSYFFLFNNCDVVMLYVCTILWSSARRSTMCARLWWVDIFNCCEALYFHLSRQLVCWVVCCARQDSCFVCVCIVASTANTIGVCVCFDVCFAMVIERWCRLSAAHLSIFFSHAIFCCCFILSIFFIVNCWRKNTTSASAWKIFKQKMVFIR